MSPAQNMDKIFCKFVQKSLEKRNAVSKAKFLPKNDSKMVPSCAGPYCPWGPSGHSDVPKMMFPATGSPTPASWDRKMFPGTPGGAQETPGGFSGVALGPENRF